MTDWQLIQQHLAGDPTALETLIRRHIHLVYTAAIRTARCSPADAEDVTQAVFFLLSQKAARISSRDSLTGWLYQTTRRCAANLHKQNRRRHRLLKEAAMQPASTPASSPLENAAHLEFLQPALDHLKAVDRDIILLRYLAQKSLEETAASLAISPEAARKRTDRALEKLRHYFAAKNIPAPAALPALLSALHLQAPPALIETTCIAAAAPPAHIVALAGKIHFLSAPAKILLTASTLIVLTAGIGLLLPSVFAAAPVPMTTIAATSPALPDLTLTAKDPAHPTDAEIKSLLKARLTRLRNFTIHYTVHTDYPAPPEGWPKIPTPDPDAAPHTVLTAGPAIYLNLMLTRPSGYPTTYLFPTGSVDSEKSLSILDNNLRYERTLLRSTPLTPYPTDIHFYQSQTYVVTPDRIDRLFDGHLTSIPSTNQLLPIPPEPDIEPALLLRMYVRTQGRLSSSEKHYLYPFIADDLDSLHISTSDNLVIVTASPTTYLRGPLTTRPATTHPTTTRPTKPYIRHEDQWTLDPTQNYAPIAYDSPRSGLHMTMSNFHNVAGLMIPFKIQSHFSLNRTPTDPDYRTDTLTVTDCQINSPANTPNLYTLDVPDAPPDFPIDTRTPLEDIEATIVGQPVSEKSLYSLLPDTQRQPSYGSPSTPVSLDTPQFHDAHQKFIARAQQNNIDLLLIGDDFAAHWSDNPDTWKQFGDPARTANFGLTGDHIENTLYRITHGELPTTSPKTILLFTGNSDALSYGNTSPSSNSHRTAVPMITFPLQGIDIHTLSREDSPEDIAAGIQLLVETLHKKCPTSKILLLSLPLRPSYKRNAENILDPRIPLINDALTALNLPNTTLITLTPPPLDPEGNLPKDTYPKSIPSPALYEKWTTQLLPQLK